MTDEVAELVLQEQLRAGRDADASPRRRRRRCSTCTRRFIRGLEASRELDRELEALPGDDELAERKREHAGLTRPELAVLLAYSEDRPLRRAAGLRRPRGPVPVRASSSATSPRRCRSASATRMREHRLRREIIATQVVNNLRPRRRARRSRSACRRRRARAAVGHRARVRGGARGLRDAAAVGGDRGARQLASPPSCRPRCCSRAASWSSAASRWLLRNRRAPAGHRGDGRALRARRGGALRRPSPTLLAPADARAADAARRGARGGGRAGGARGARGGLRLRCSRRSTSSTSPARRASTSSDVAAVHFRLGSGCELHWLRDRITDAAARGPLERAGARRAARRPVRAAPRAHRRGAARPRRGADVDDARRRAGSPRTRPPSAACRRWPTSASAASST